MYLTSSRDTTGMVIKSFLFFRALPDVLVTKHLGLTIELFTYVHKNLIKH